MNRHCPGRRKLVHVDATLCAEMSNTADGTKCLREPMSTSADDSKMSQALLPRPSRKRIKSCNESFQLSGISEFSNNCVVDASDTNGCRKEWTEVGFSDNESAQPKCAVEFVSARKYMNPTFSLLDDHVPQNNIAASIQPARGSVPESKANRKPNIRRIASPQKNTLDRYLKPVCVSKTSTASAVADTQSYTVCSAEHTASHTVTPENSPRKSVLLSPISKLPGSDNIYYCSPSSQNSISRDSITSSQSSSSAGNVFESHRSFASASALCDDDDDLDFEATLDSSWKTNPRVKRKCARQLDQSSKKKATQTFPAAMSEIGRKSVSTECIPGNSTGAPMLQENDAVSSDMSAENFGLFGFSNGTLLALDSDTDFEEDTNDYFSSLPLEVVSNILCRLPFTDLCLNVNRVCLSWKNIIDSENVSYVIVL